MDGVEELQKKSCSGYIYSTEADMTTYCTHVVLTPVSICPTGGSQADELKVLLHGAQAVSSTFDRRENRARKAMVSLCTTKGEGDKEKRTWRRFIEEPGQRKRRVVDFNAAWKSSAHRGQQALKGKRVGRSLAAFQIALKFRLFWSFWEFNWAGPIRYPSLSSSDWCSIKLVPRLYVTWSWILRLLVCPLVHPYLKKHFQAFSEEIWQE